MMVLVDAFYSKQPDCADGEQIMVPGFCGAIVTGDEVCRVELSLFFFFFFICRILPCSCFVCCYMVNKDEYYATVFVSYLVTHAKCQVKARVLQTYTDRLGPNH